MHNVESIKACYGGKHATKKGKLCCIIKHVDGSITEKVLSPVKHCYKSETNPFSIICELSQGATLGNDAHKKIALKKGDKLVVFDC